MGERHCHGSIGHLLNYRLRCPGGESVEDMRIRVDTVITKVPNLVQVSLSTQSNRHDARVGPRNP